MSKRDDDLAYMNRWLARFEQDLATTRALMASYGDAITLAELQAKLLREVDNLEYCFRRDRINHRRRDDRG